MENKPEEKNETLENIYSTMNPLTEEEAKLRASLVKNNKGEYEIQYKNLLVLRRKSDSSVNFPETNFDGKTEISFTFFNLENMNLKEQDFFLNFVGEVKAFYINHQEEKINYKNQRIFIDVNKLKKSEVNTVTVLFSTRYNHSGVGLHHYVDTSDNKEYLYTQFEPFDCNKVFPAFDQPDMKAKMKLYSIAPKEWIVLSNEFEEENTKEKEIPLTNKNQLKEVYGENSFSLNDAEYEHLISANSLEKKEYNLHEFINTDRISSYLYALCAGAYHRIKCPFPSKVPLNIYLRESLKNQGKINEFFQATIAAMKFYENYFGIPFPFRKYDQIFCPEYNMGAMENVGLVTFNEFYCFKDPPTKRLMSNFLITVTHELAHMWFGNLVTMVWWNDLWLNESFATFISHLCLANTPELKEYAEMSWLIFNTGKGYAYKADQQSTTHPVMSEVKNTEIAETHFDEIVYEKGSSFLKQVFYFISNDQFSNGLKNYFKEFKWTNTTFPDFIGKMSELEYCKNMKNTYGMNETLEELCDSHLKKSGLNEIELKMDVDSEGNITKFDLIQEPCINEEPHNNRQTHLIEVLFLNKFEDIDSQENTIYKNVLIKSEKITSIEMLIGKKAPEAVIINYNDWGYFKWIIDRKSINSLKTNLPFVKDNLTKSLVYRSLFDMLRDSRISGFEYFKIIERFLQEENSEIALPVLLRNLNGAISNYIPLEFYEKFTSEVFDIIWNKLKIQVDLYNKKSPNANKDLILSLIQHLLSFSSSEKHIRIYEEWLTNNSFSIENVEFEKGLITLENKFTMVKLIFSSREISNEKKEELLEGLVKEDNNTDRSILARHYCNAVKPCKENKKKIFEKLVNEGKSDSLYNMEATMSGFMPISQMDLTEEYSKVKFFEVVEKVAKENVLIYLKSFIYSLGPYYYPENEISEKLEKLRKDTVNNDILNKYIKELIDDLNRKKKAYGLCEEYLKENPNLN